MMTVPFVDLKAQHESVRDQVQRAMLGVADRAEFILGPAVSKFEAAFAAYCGANHAVGLDSGISALELALRACNVGPGDEVITPSHTFIATVSSISFTGATPVFVDVRPHTYLVDPERIEHAITPRTRAIMAVHLYGQPAEMDAIVDIARRKGLFLIEDAAQAHGAEYHGRRVGTFGTVGCFSFYPAKNLGAYGDAGAIVTNDAAIAKHIEMLRNYGQRRKYDHVYLAYNRRIDTLQAAILDVKLRYLDQWNRRRTAAAARYCSQLADCPAVVLPSVSADVQHVYHLFVIQHPKRDDLMKHLAARGISCGLHYPIPVHKQECYAHLAGERLPLTVTDRLGDRVLSLPMFPEITDDQIDHVCEAIHDFENASR
jgi:dTDP-4-amino-4,6-dideoxygalactose transaminase